MPLILAPYTLGAQLVAPSAGVRGGGAFAVRRRKQLGVLFGLLLFLLMVP